MRTIYDFSLNKIHSNGRLADSKRTNGRLDSQLAYDNV